MRKQNGFMKRRSMVRMFAILKLLVALKMQFNSPELCEIHKSMKIQREKVSVTKLKPWNTSVLVSHLLIRVVNKFSVFSQVHIDQP